jgi:hypothetical protein
MKVINVLLFTLGECVHLVFRIVSNMFLRQKFDLAFEPGLINLTDKCYKICFQSKLEFAINKPNIFDILKKQLSSVPAKKRKSTAVGSAAVAKKVTEENPSESGDVAKDDDQVEILSVKSQDSDENSQGKGSDCKIESDYSDTDTKLETSVRGNVGSYNSSKLIVTLAHFKTVSKGVTSKMDASSSCHAATTRPGVGIFASFKTNLNSSESKTKEVGNDVVESEKAALAIETNINASSVQPVVSENSELDKVLVKKELGTENKDSFAREKPVESLFQPVISNTRTVPNPLVVKFTPNFTPTNLAPMPGVGVPDYFGPTPSVATYGNFLKPPNFPPVPAVQTVTGLDTNPATRTVSCPSFTDLQNSTGFFGDLLATDPESPSDFSGISRPASFASFSEPTTGLLLPNVLVKQEPLDVSEQSSNPINNSFVKEEDPDPDDLITSVLGLDKVCI